MIKKGVLLGLALGAVGTVTLIQKNKHIAKFLTKNS